MHYKTNTPSPWEALYGFGCIICAGYAAALGAGGTQVAPAVHSPARLPSAPRQARALGSCKGI